MKSFKKIATLPGIAILCGLLFSNCKKSVESEQETNESGTTVTNGLSVEQLNSLAQQLSFLSATKKDGTPPSAPSTSSLQISLRDTLYLHPGVHVPVKFLHEASSKNVKGAYVQVKNSKGKEGKSNFYYDVLEVAEMSENDLVSILDINFSTPSNAGSGGNTGNSSPDFEISITPYDEGGTPIVQTSLPVVIRKPKPNGNHNTDGGPCSLVTEGDDVWDWDLTYTDNPGAGKGYLFYAEPTRRIAKDQSILGCCSGGFSYYLPGCQLPMKFKTFYQRMGENISFRDDGTYLRFTYESAANPAPDESDWCSGNAVVHEKLTNGLIRGTWVIKDQPVPASLKEYDHIRHQLQMRVTSSNGLGFGNTGGFIHQLDCNSMILIEPDREGFGPPTFKFYSRRNSTDPGWYPTK